MSLPCLLCLIIFLLCYTFCLSIPKKKIIWKCCIYSLLKTAIKVKLPYSNNLTKIYKLSKSSELYLFLSLQPLWRSILGHLWRACLTVLIVQKWNALPSEVVIILLEKWPHICDNQPGRWPPLTSDFWYLCPCVILSQIWVIMCDWYNMVEVLVCHF